MDGHFVGSTMLPIGDIGMNFDEPEKSINGKLNKIDKAIDSLEGNTELQTITKELQAESYSQKESELTAEAKQIHRGLLRIQRSVSKRFEADTKKLFKKQMADIVSKFGQKSFYKASAMNVSDVFDFEMWVMQFEELGDEYLTEALMRAGEEFANSIDDVFILSDPRIEDYIGTRAKEYATIVNNTTKEKIDKLL